MQACQRCPNERASDELLRVEYARNGQAYEVENLAGSHEIVKTVHDLLHRGLPVPLYLRYGQRAGEGRDD